MSDLVVSRIVGSTLVRVGLISRMRMLPTFTYDRDYLAWEEAIPLSRSLPLRKAEFDATAVRPYFDGLLPEGPTRAALAARAETSEDDYLTLLELGGLDCVGDVVVRPVGSPDEDWNEGSYVPLTQCEMIDLFKGFDTLATMNLESRLSLAGTQGKVGLTHRPDRPIDAGWLRPVGGAGSTHILKATYNSRIGEFEAICMRAACSCGLHAATTDAIFAGRPVVVSERYDRSVTTCGSSVRVTRLHQEDLAQAFGLSSASKYLELPGGTYASVSSLLHERSASVMEDIEQLARIAVYDYLVGNCDNHLKNLSVVYRGATMRLAPVYDVTCTTFFERFDRTMGRRLGSASRIDDVEPSDFGALARELGMGSRRMRAICEDMAESIVPSILEAGEYLDEKIEGIAFAAEDLVEELGERREVVRAVGMGYS